MKTEQVFLHTNHLIHELLLLWHVFIQLYRVKSDPGVIIFQIFEGKFQNFYEKS